MIIPPFLQSGRTVGLVAPGRKVAVTDIEKAVEAFESWGLNVVIGKNIFSKNHSYLSGTDQERCEDMQTMLDDATIAAIVCARGGYGTTRFIDSLNFTRFLSAPKWLVGFSDVTALHLRIHKLDIESIHGIMPILFGKINTFPSIESLHKILWGERNVLEWESLKHSREGKTTGNIIGGNLSLIVDSLGTADEVDTKGKILVIEEVEEYRYKIDRMMMQLKRAGKLQNLAGLVIGHLTNVLDTELTFGESAEELIIDKVREYNYPVSFGFPSGHEMPNLSWRHGSNMLFEVGPDTSLLQNID